MIEMVSYERDDGPMLLGEAVSRLLGMVSNLVTEDDHNVEAIRVAREWCERERGKKVSATKDMVERAEDLAYVMISTGEGMEIAKDNVFDYLWAHTGLEVDARESARSMAEKIVTETEARYRKSLGG